MYPCSHTWKDVKGRWRCRYFQHFGQCMAYARRCELASSAYRQRQAKR